MVPNYDKDVEKTYTPDLSSEKSKYEYRIFWPKRVWKIRECSIYYSTIT